LDIVVLQSAAVLELAASEEETLLVGLDVLVVLDKFLKLFDGAAHGSMDSDYLACESLYEELDIAGKHGGESFEGVLHLEEVAFVVGSVGVLFDDADEASRRTEHLLFDTHP
jgi:hypothetical protein